MKQKNNLLLFCLALLLCTGLHGQEHCGIDTFAEAVMNEDSVYHSRQDTFEQGYVASLLYSGPTGNETAYEIPLVFHILYKDEGGPEDISYEQIYQAVEQMNAQFAGGEGGYDTKIRFSVASVSPEGVCPVVGITRTQTSTPGIKGLSSINDYNLKNHKRWYPVNRYVNVWVVKYIEQSSGSPVAGYASYPWQGNSLHDGIVIRYDRLGTTGAASGNTRNTLTHEMGHYLGLYHVWGEIYINSDACVLNCDNNDSDCLNYGDRVCDTAPCKFYSFENHCAPQPTDCETSFCPSFPGGVYFFPKENYMSYSQGCQDRFTQGQAERMKYAIENYRSVLPLEDCNRACDPVVLHNPGYFINDYTINGTVYIPSGKSLIIRGRTILFSENGSVVVENGGKLVLDEGAVLDKCPLSDHWGGIEVKGGGELLVRDASVYNAVTAVSALPGSTLNVEDLIIGGLNSYTGTGIRIEGDVDIPLLRRVSVHEVRHGILSTEGNGRFYHFDGGALLNVMYGILLSGHSVLVNDYFISGGYSGIHLDKSPASIIAENQIGVTGTGITLNFSPYSHISTNTIGWGWGPVSSSVGISLFQSGGSLVNSNAVVLTKHLGIRLWQSDVLVTDNHINDYGSGISFGGGIQVNDTRGSHIIDNSITTSQSGFGIETVVSSGTVIEGNTVSQGATMLARSGAIRLAGSMDEHVRGNVVSGGSGVTGILVQNSTSSQYLCNAIANGMEGLSIYYNSEMQNIRGNELDASTDLVIRSQVGDQLHHGNRFIGGKARANELGFEEVQNSQFYVNSTHPTRPNLMPTDILPMDDWFINQNNLNVYTCTGVYQGPGWVAFEGGDEGMLCRYYEYLLSVKEEKPEQFAVKLIHLLRYSGKKAGFSLPGCITSDGTFLSLCGISELAGISVALEKTGETEVATGIAALRSQYLADTSALNRSLLQAELSDMEAEIALKRSQDSVRLDSIYNALLAISCPDTVVQKWKEVYMVYTKFLGGDSLDTADRTILETLSEECSDIYGDAVHLARAVANTWNETYYDAYDGCGYSVPLPFRVERGAADQIVVSPNPSTGVFNILLPEGFEGHLTVMDTKGQLLEHRRVSAGSGRNEIDLSAYSGVLLMRFSNPDGYMSVHKVTVIR